MSSSSRARGRRSWALVPCVVAVLLALAALVGAAGRGSADPLPPDNAVTHWSRIATQANSAGRPPASTQVLQGIVHAAIYDTVVAIHGGYEPFVTDPVVPSPVSTDAAVAAAARDVLVARVPGQASLVNTAYASYLAAIPGGAAKANGIALGQQVAGAILAWRAGDGFDNVVPYVQPPVGPGVFEPIGPAGVPPGTPVDVKLGQVRPLVLDDASRFRPDGPPSLRSNEYEWDFKEVKAYGRTDSSIRTAAQTDIVRFWTDQTSAQWSRGLASLALAKNLTTLESARLLAMVHVSAADAAIGCWEAKFTYYFWRPVHAIKRAGEDLNRSTVADATWEHLVTGNHPEYPSGHACVTASFMKASAEYFRTDRVSFSVDSAVAGLTSPVHTFSSFSSANAEVADARIWGGLHFRFSMVDGAQLGRDVATYVTRGHFRPATG